MHAAVTCDLREANIAVCCLHDALEVQNVTDTNYMWLLTSAAVSVSNVCNLYHFISESCVLSRMYGSRMFGTLDQGCQLWMGGGWQSCKT